MRKFKDSPEEAKIRELIVERGLGGKLSPKMVLHAMLQKKIKDKMAALRGEGGE